MTYESNPSWGPAAKGPPRQLVVLCHGVGADGHDLIDLAPYWSQALPEAVFLAPHAPEPFDMAAAGMPAAGRQWFSIGDLDPAKFGPGVRRAASWLDAVIDDALSRHGLPPTEYALMGFSQGAMTALFTGLRRPHAPRAILAFAGALIEPETLAAEMRTPAPVLLAHGEADAIVPAFRTREAEAALRAAGVPVEVVFSPKLEHGIDDVLLTAGAMFLQRAFAQP